VKKKNKVVTKPKIEKVFLRYGFLQVGGDTPKSSSSGLSDIEFSGKEIPEKVISQIYEDDLFSLGSSYGDSSLGNPIEFNFLRVTADGKDYEVEVQNLGILMIFENNDETRRVFRIVNTIKGFSKT